MTAQYSGDGNYPAFTFGNNALSVGRGDTSNTSLSLSTTSVTAGNPVTLTAFVGGHGHIAVEWALGPAADLDMHCSCPDWGVPCKHLAAVCYVLAEAFDDDPFAMLAWRGRGREELLGALRRQSSAPGPGCGPSAI